jgi:hypothetical protein
METYKASLDYLSKFLTGLIFFVGIFGIGLMLTQQPWYGGLVVTLVPVIILIPSYMYSVKGYQITGGKLVIQRVFSKLNREIKLSEIESVSIPLKSDFRWTIRTFGNGGVFGYYGMFANPKLGSFREYVTNRKNRIMIILKATKNKIVISPEDMGMAEVLEMAIKRQA